jgi:hypothetical protein
MEKLVESIYTEKKNKIPKILNIKICKNIVQNKTLMETPSASSPLHYNILVLGSH